MVRCGGCPWCRFIYRVEVTGTGPGMHFTATARAISGPIAGTTMKIDQTGVLTISPMHVDACQ